MQGTRHPVDPPWGLQRTALFGKHPRDSAPIRAPEACHGNVHARRGSRTQSANPGVPAVQSSCPTPSGSGNQCATTGAPEASSRNVRLARKGKEPLTKSGWEVPRTTTWTQCSSNHSCHHRGAHGTCVSNKGAHATRGGPHNTRRNHEGARNAHVHHTQRWSIWSSRTWQSGHAGGGQSGRHTEGWSNWASSTRKCSEACGGQPGCREDGAAKTVTQQVQP